MMNQESKLSGRGDVFDNMDALESDEEQDECNTYINKKKLEYIIKNQDLVNQLPKFIKRAINNTDSDSDSDGDSDSSSNGSKSEIYKPYNSLIRDDEEVEPPSKSNIFIIPDDPCENQLEVSNQIKEFNKLSEEYSKLEIDCKKLEIDSGKLENDSGKPENDSSKIENDSGKLENDSSKLENDSSKLEIDSRKVEIESSKLEFDCGNNNDFLNISSIREDETIEADNNFSSIGSEGISQSFKDIDHSTSEKDQIDEMNKLTFKSDDISSFEIQNSKSDNNISISGDSDSYKEFLDIIYYKDGDGINNINRDNNQIQDNSINSNSTFQTKSNLFSKDNSQTQDRSYENSTVLSTNYNIFSNDRSQSQDRSYGNSIELAANYNIFSNDDSGEGSIGIDNQLSLKKETSFMNNSRTSGDLISSGSLTEFKFSPNKNSKSKYTTISKPKSPYNENHRSNSSNNKYNRNQFRSPDNRTNTKVNEFVFGNSTGSSNKDFEDSNKVKEFVYDPSNISKTKINSNLNNRNSNKNDNTKYKSSPMGGSKFGKRQQRKYINKNDPNINEIGEGSKLTFEDE